VGAYLGLALCHYQLGDIANTVNTLKEFAEIKIEINWQKKLTSSHKLFKLANKISSNQLSSEWGVGSREWYGFQNVQKNTIDNFSGVEKWNKKKK